MPLLILLLFVFSGQPDDVEKCPSSTGMYLSMNEALILGDRLKAIAVLERLESQWRSCDLEKDSTYARILHELGKRYWELNDINRGIAFTGRSIKLNSLKSKRFLEKSLCNSYFNLALMHGDKGEVEECIKMFRKSIAVGLKYPEKLFIVSKAYKEIASVQFAEGDYENTILTGEKGYLIAKGLENNVLMAESLIEAAQARIWMDSVAAAKRTLDQVSNLNTDKPRHLGAVHSLYAELSKRAGSYGEGVSHYQKSFNYFLEGGLPYGCGQALLNQGYLYAENLKDFSKANQLFTRSLDYFVLPKDKALVFNTISETKLKAGSVSEALEYNKRASELFFGASGNKAGYAGSIRNVVDKSILLGITIQKGNILLEQSRLSGSKKGLSAVLNNYMLADTMISYMRWEHFGNQTKLFWRDQTRVMYQNAMEAAFLSGDVNRALYFLEKSRAVLLSDQINELNASQQLSPEDKKRERKLRDKVAGLQLKLSETGTEKELARLREELNTAQQEQEHFIKGVERTNPQYYAYKYDNKVPSIKEIRNTLLSEGQTLLSFFVGDNAVYGLAIARHKVVFRKIDLAVYRNLTGRFNGLVGDPEAQNKNFGTYLQVSSRLYELLVRSFGIAEGSRVVVSPDGRFMPFGAWSKSASAPDYLVRHYTFSYTYSAVLLAKGGRKAKGSWMAPVYMGLAPVNFSSTLKQVSLPGSEEALARISSHFFRSSPLVGTAATRGAFVRNSSDYRIVQLLTHASADSSGKVPTLYFADSTLKLSELTAPEKPVTELMVLSACQTGVGKNQPGEGVFSLARGFAGIGIPTTLTTLWSVENQAIYRLTEAFFERMKNGDPLDRALQRAQNDWLDQASKSQQLPYVWAGIVLIGNAGPVDTSLSPGVAYAGITLLVILALVFVYFAKKKFGRAD